MLPRLAPVVCSLALLAAFPTSSNAQSFTFGGKGGVALSTISFDDPTLSASSDGVGLVAGGFAGLHLFGRLGVQVEASFAETRVTVEDIVHDKLSYLDVPVLARYRVFGTTPKWRVHALGGVMWSSLLSAKETVGSSTSDVKDGIESSDLSLAVGGDVEVHPRWLVDARYVMGRDEVYKAFNAASFGLRRGWQITAVYRVK
jgi:hypothetical protein